MTKFCPECGAENEDIADFCRDCGCDLSGLNERMKNSDRKVPNKIRNPQTIHRILK